MREVKTEVIIDAPKELVWQVLTDFGAYNQWNPVVTDVKATPVVNRTIRFKLNLFGAKLPVAAKIQRCEENWYFGWGTDTNLPTNHIIGAHHFFELNDEGNGSTRVVHSEIFYGIVPKLAWRLLSKLEAKYNEMNAAFKQQVESVA